MALQETPFLSTPIECAKCHSLCFKVCPTCKGGFCDEHTSPVDDAVCSLCLPDSVVVIEEKPLIDDEGVSHEGKLIVPSGEGFKTLPHQIVELSDYQLKARIQYYKEKIRQLEKSLEYHRISLSTMELEDAGREVIRDKKLRGVKVAVGGGVKIGGSTNGKAKPLDAKGLADLLKAKGISADVLRGILAAKQKRDGN
jgi:hypothetical protein